MEANFFSTFDSALLNPNLCSRCQALEQVIDKAPIRVLQQTFTKLVHDIFGYNRPGWGLPVLTTSRPSDFQAVKHFLGVKGVIICLLNKLQNDTSRPRFEFVLPETSVLINKSNVNLNHAYKPANINVSLTAYEFYFCHFASCITRENMSVQPTNYRQTINTGIHNVIHRTSFHNTQLQVADDCIYFALLDDYLQYFFPIDGSPFPSMTNLGQKSLQASYQYENFYGRNDTGKNQRTNTQYMCQASTFDLWCPELLLNVFIEFWLSSQNVNQKLNSPKQNHPVENQVRSLRQVIKHLHYFTNSADRNVLTHVTHDASFGFTQIANMITTVFYGNVFEFISHCFDTWPLDGSFRIVLETWLSFIQPWRYVHGENKNEAILSEDREIANSWYGFINTNIEFYIVLLKKMVNRFLRMDLSNTKNTILLIRVAKIYAQPNLLDLIDEADEAKCNKFGQSLGSYLHSSPNPNANMSSVAKTLFTEEFIATMQQLLTSCAKACISIQQQMTLDSNHGSFSLLKFVGLGALETNSTTDNNIQELKKSEQHLLQAMAYLQKSFELIKPNMNQIKQESAKIRNRKANSWPDHMLSPDGSFQLTDKGRYEVISQQKRGPMICKTHPDLMPIASGENTMLVRNLYKLSKQINTKQVEIFLENICSRDDLFGKFSSFIFIPQHSFSSPVKHAYKPRISFRFWAHYQTLFYLGLWLLFTWITGASWIKSSVCGIIFLIVYFFLDYLLNA